MTDAAHEYQQGDMDIREQEATFEAFGKMIKWGSLAIAVLLVALVLWFCVQAGFFAGAGAAVVLTAAGVFFLREKPNAGH
ncbi:MAG TPA: aa3-type cytochrome c oxidase subunit IV [Caulobacteraceae bacterium]|nr:aa3-type cytochrome c oxidase subunit IV [Caulobacteraceae bacterium]